MNSSDAYPNEEDRTIVETLERENKELRRDLAYHANSLKAARRRLHGPSFLKELESYKEYIKETGLSPRFASLPTRDMTYKLRTYQKALSHGIAVPEIFDVWCSIDRVDFSLLPEAFVLKSDGGSTSHGVLPLRRVAPDLFRTADKSRLMTSGEIVEHFRDAYSSKSAYGVMFAEELLQPMDSADRIPDDVKVYVAYGSVVQILLRRVDVHGSAEDTRSKYIDENGADLGAVANYRRLDPDIPVPELLPELVSISKHLSRASGLPFCRVDLYETVRGAVLGEVTLTPGGPQSYVADHDHFMGTRWHLANAELLTDYQLGRPSGAIWGMHPVPRYYEQVSDPQFPSVPEVYCRCEEWCFLDSSQMGA